ncbi:cysteine desulfurase family protein [Pseudomonas alloputida]|uniref:cysteine desulfurase n=1 Tax=Pseudomonas alloputida TaxID=1940621 RepID=A0AAW7HNS5_9PSED|nr:MULTISPECIES: cysteine desulfurase family protein [Pseudomonas]MCE0864184.1 cysteine desulfurase [Pseudomonas alloputida]MCE0870655.1 cysteine desulfurase [Pseudomonas alloputida]MCE0893219.1 cysteine desulfurase [Pseudomonas alloputida]MCE0922352.1 cysteine desulfurase [Pseudomonas alloputida]MCE1048614.1 cysteine desulfurase [Pseudomonas alloputida]
MQPDSVIYLDAAATTPCADDVIKEMAKYDNINYGNPSSAHILGRLARSAVFESASHISELLGCTPAEIVFTSGATESNNIAILGSATTARSNIIICPIDHKSSILAAEELEKRNIEIRRMKIDSDGRVNLTHLNSLLDENTSLLSISYVNSEIGTFQNLLEIKKALENSNALFHVDAAQALGKLPINVKELGVDCASISAHKIEGPKGISALYVSSSSFSRLRPLTFGGGQSSLRSGTLPTQLIAGFGAAARRLKNKDYPASWSAAKQLRNAILETLNKHDIAFLINSPDAVSTPHILNISILGMRSETLISSLRNVCISSGSACNSNNLSPSYVITGIGHSAMRANSAIRLSFTSDMDIKTVRAGAESLSQKVLQLIHLNHRGQMK